MQGVLGEFVELVEGLGQTELHQIAFTVGAIVAIVAVRLGAGWWRGRNGSLSSKERLFLSTAIAATTAVSVLSIIAVWGLGGQLMTALENIDLAGQFQNIVLAVVLVASAYAVTDFLGGVIHEVSRESTAINDHQEEVLRRITQLGIYTVVTLVVIGLFTDNVGSLLVGAGFLGIVVGMAARQTLGAVLAGFVLMFSRPFEVGDWVEIGDLEGTVTEISIINTRLRSFDGEHVTIPNDEVRSSPVIDRSWRNRLRIEVEVAIDYDADPNRAAAVAVDAIEDVEGIASMPGPDVVCKEFADSGVVLGVRYWIRDPSMRKRWRTQTAVMAAVKAAFEHEGITIPFPQQTLSTREGGLDVAVGDSLVPDDESTDDSGRGDER